ncbi:MAG: phosphoenolpyruvate--protein phosphotransferase [Desulfuromonadaceae bacterium GWC2_58_13]|nr:MAG: phosphoenolpyruvate--protein phosphotransferase [Desulfuromonadaceae bacterium GWC2_58_13]
MALEKIDIPQDTLLVGVAASPGIALGQTYSVDRARMSAVERRISADEVPEQIQAFMEAVRLSRAQLEEVRSAVNARGLAEHLYILDTHLLILEDQMLLNGTTALIRDEFLNAEGALKRTLKKFQDVFNSIEDEYLRERRSDIDSVGERLLRNLKGQSQQPILDIDRQVIVVAHDMSPADTMLMDKARIIGFVTDLGGRTSHTAILARSLGIPAVIGLETVTTRVPSGTQVIVDGTLGYLVLNPSAETYREYEEKQQAYENREAELLSRNSLPAETLDGCRVRLRGNVELAAELPLALRYGAEGVGLFRSEFLYLNRAVPPSETDQVVAYRSVVEAMVPHPVTIRSLDLGGDKFAPEINVADEPNPAMGLRAVRFSLKERRLFKTQLRAILRASAFGQVRLMFPMISGVAEIRACKDLLAEARAELVAEGIDFDPHMPIGIMIEIPSAALIADLLAREVDFFSVGTNDLIQYCLAVDRSNEHVAYLYEPLHPAILRALQAICRAARQAGISVGMCGEMAADPLYTLILLGLGFDELSMNPPSIPRVKEILRLVRREEGELLLTELLSLATASEINRRLDAEMNRRFPEVFKPFL